MVVEVEEQLISFSRRVVLEACLVLSFCFGLSFLNCLVEYRFDVGGIPDSCYQSFEEHLSEVNKIFFVAILFIIASN